MSAGRGEIMELEPGRKYRIRANIGSGPNRRRPSRIIHGNLTAARKALTRLLAEIDEQKLRHPTRLTVARLIEEHAQARRSEWSKKHYTEYLTILRNYIAPHIGHIRASDLTPKMVQDWLKKLEERRSARSGHPISSSTRNAAYRVAHSAFEEAVRLEMLSRNPIHVVRAPKVEVSRAPDLSARDLVSLEVETAGTILHIPVMLAIRTGLRRGELLALRWRDVCLNEGEAYINVKYSIETATQAEIRLKAPKTNRPRRVQIDDVMRAALVEWKAEQSRLMASEYGLKVRPSQWICSHADGSPILPNFLSKQFLGLLRRLGMDHPGRSFKSLRAAHETLLADAGFDRFQLGRRLGHSPRVAEDRYIGELSASDRRAADALGALLNEVAEQCGTKVVHLNNDKKTMGWHK